ncbi:hypothetical protein CLOBOL_01517 [Enterocloster bolteae ATCC BAA-613]|uniref:Uncharacterized protein n=1 Tax=Enterocloster bolteae (strain ATCC BAA-613 / DSM 15670 / CCUG 46953 / JCM 12243 / WAL 16351) TaxID=411902 RepID=A8RL64_ENTBW|nr:hypothetical protein CLOBOL_01517 [Enterocloster bolteae ATCC BAA-613]
MAVTVIYLFEMVQVQNDHGSRLLPAQMVVHPAFHGDAVIQSGQSIQFRQGLQGTIFLLQLFARLFVNVCMLSLFHFTSLQISRCALPFQSTLQSPLHFLTADRLHEEVAHTHSVGLYSEIQVGNPDKPSGERLRAGCGIQASHAVQGNDDYVPFPSFQGSGQFHPVFTGINLYFKVFFRGPFKNVIYH